jgi:hypothetical protein
MSIFKKAAIVYFLSIWSNKISENKLPQKARFNMITPVTPTILNGGTTFSTMTFATMTFSIMTFSIMTFRIMTFSCIECHYAECRYYLNVVPSVIMMNVVVANVIVLNVVPTFKIVGVTGVIILNLAFSGSLFSLILLLQIERK